MKKLLLCICIICFVVDAIYSIFNAQYMGIIKDIALILLTCMMGNHYLKKE